MTILSNDPVGKDLFEGKSQEKIAELIFRSLETARTNGVADGPTLVKSIVIGVEGGWGCGKSNVIKILEQKLAAIKNDDKKKAYSVFMYDLWGRQQDLQRNVILQDLSRHLNEKCNINKDKKVRELIRKKKEVEGEFCEDGLVVRLTPVFLMTLVSVLLSLNSLIPESWRLWLKIAVWILVLVSCVCGLLAVWKFRQDASVAVSKFFTNMLFSKNGVGLPRLLYEYQYSVTVSDFSELLAEISDELVSRQKQLIIVFDNIDRLHEDRVKEFLASAHILFAERNEKCLSNIHVIIPFDRQRILQAFNGADGNDYINKTFDVVYRVAPPILKDWKKLFQEKFRMAVADEPALMAQYDDVQDVFDKLSALKNVTPRAIIAFLNAITTLHNVVGEEIPLRTVAIYELGWRPCEQGATAKDGGRELPETKIRSGDFIRNNLLKTKYLADDREQVLMAAVVFQVDATRAKEILNYNLLKDALETGKGGVVGRMCDLESFRILFERALTDVQKPENIPLALRGFDGPQKNWCWDVVNDERGKDIAMVSLLTPELDEWHKLMLQNVQNWKLYAERLTQRGVPVKDRGAIVVQFARLRNVDDALASVSRTLRGVLPVDVVEPLQYLEMLNTAKERFEIVCWRCDAKVLDDLVDKRIREGYKDGYGVQYVEKEVARKLVKTKLTLEKRTSVDTPYEKNVSQLLRALERLGDGRINTSIDQAGRQAYVFANHIEIEELCRAYAISVKYKIAIRQDSALQKFAVKTESVQYALTLVEVFKRYVSVIDVIGWLVENERYPIYVSAAKMLVETSEGKFEEKDAELLLGCFGKIVELLQVDAQRLAIRLPDLKEIDEARHSKCFPHATLIALKKCGGPVWNFAVDSIKRNLNGFDGQKWIEKLSSAKARWTPRAAVDIGYFWPKLAIDSAREVLENVADGKFQDTMPSVDMWKLLVDDFERKHVGVGEVFRDLKDRIISNAKPISSKAFVFLSTWLFKYGEFGQNKAELRKILPDATVRKNDECKSIISANKEVVMDMFEVSEDKDAFRTYVSMEIKSDANSPLRVFEEILKVNIEGGK